MRSSSPRHPRPRTSPRGAARHARRQLRERPACPGRHRGDHPGAGPVADRHPGRRQPARPTRRSPVNGTNATANAELRVWLPSHGKRLKTLTTTATHNVRVEGRLRNRDTNQPITGATVTLVSQNVYVAEWAPVINLVTDANGRFAAAVGPGFHRRFAAIYYPAIVSPSPVFSSRTLVRARSTVALLRPFNKRRSYRFDGQVSAGVAPVPATGLVIALQVHNRTGWVTARLAKSRATGRFRIRYTFPNAASLAVRVLVPSQPGWALYAGHSPTRRIHPPNDPPRSEFAR